MTDETMRKEYPDSEQRLAVCETRWAETGGSSDLDEARSLSDSSGLSEGVSNLDGPSGGDARAECGDLVIGPGEVELTAAGEGKKKRPRVSMLAYSGGVMTVPDWGAVVIDLAGLDISGQITFLSGHKNELGEIIGHGRAQVRDNALYVEGVLTEATEAGRQVLALTREGVELRASVGVEPRKSQKVRAGDTVQVNGRTLKAEGRSLTLIEKGRLREVSVVALGADADTQISIAARRRTMADETEVVEGQKGIEQVRASAAVKAGEEARIVTIHNLCAEYEDQFGAASNADLATIKAKAVSEGWDARETELALIRGARPSLRGFVPRGAGSPQVEPARLLGAAALLHAGRADVAETAYGEQTAQQAEDLRTGSMVDLCRAALRLEHVDEPRSRREMIEAAFSTRSLPVALGDAANKVVQQAYRETPATWRSFANVQPAADFKDHNVIRPTWGGTLEQVAGDGELKHATLSEETGTFSVGTYGEVLQVSRQDIINDDAGVIRQTAAAFGRMAMRSLNDLVWSTILANAGNFFHADNENLLTGADSDLDAASLANAIAAMRGQRDTDGNDLDILPQVLAVPPELEVTGRALLESLEIQAAEGEPSGNALKGAASLEVESRISNTEKFANASTTAWYLLASPQDMPVVVGFLDGRQSPTVEYMGLNQQVNVLAVAWRVYSDYGAMLNDPRAAVRSDGA